MQEVGNMVVSDDEEKCMDKKQCGREVAKLIPSASGARSNAVFPGQIKASNSQDHTTIPKMPNTYKSNILTPLLYFISQSS